MTRLDRQILAAECAVDAAFRAKDTRRIHASLNALRALRHERLRRELFWRNLRAWLGPLGRIAATVVAFAWAALMYALVDAPEAYAGTPGPTVEGSLWFLPLAVLALLIAGICAVKWIGREPYIPAEPGSSDDPIDYRRFRQ